MSVELAIHFRLTYICFTNTIAWLSSNCQAITAMSRTIAFLILVFASVNIAGSCSQTSDPDDPCLDETKFSTDKADIYYAGDGVTREVIFVFKDIPEDICPDEHVTVDYTIYIASAGIAFDTMKKVGKASWPPSYERTELLQRNPDSGNRYDGTEAGIGLKQAFSKDGEAAYIGLSISLFFPSHGDRNADSTFLANYGPSGRVTLTYHPKK